MALVSALGLLPLNRTATQTMVRKHLRSSKRQLGQFMTPPQTARELVQSLPLSASDRVLEPGFGKGAFLIPLIERFLELRGGDLGAVLRENIFGVELDPALFQSTLHDLAGRFGPLPVRHNLVLDDYLLTTFRESAGTDRDSGGHAAIQFDLVVGNPPFGGTLPLEQQDILDRRFGRRHGLKIKKETYSFFLVKAVESLRMGGRLRMICSDTFLTIPTMKGLRRMLMEAGECRVVRLSRFSEETDYPMVVLDLVRANGGTRVFLDGQPLNEGAIKRTGTLSWQVSEEYDALFRGPKLGDFIVATSGMTTGKNEYFVREIVDGAIEEPFCFEFFDDPITLEKEVRRARLHRLSDAARANIARAEAAGHSRRNVRIERLSVTDTVALPHPSYRFYNKSQPGLFYASPRYAIYWANDGEAVRTFKKNGNWYLHGMGGAPYFGREGITWRLVAASIEPRYLPAGFILDSGAPCAFLRPGIPHEELWFILGFLSTRLATRIQKEVLNHTMNIQGKDVERLPYPWWVAPDGRQSVVRLVKGLVERAKDGEVIARDHPQLKRLEELFSVPGGEAGRIVRKCA